MKLLGRDPDEGEDERLLNLFRNRAELKQAFADLQARLRKAEEKLVTQESATRRAEERLRSVEELLAKPGSGYKAMAYFQLRALWHENHDRLQALSDQLKGTYEDRMRREILMRFNQERQRQLAALDEEIAADKAELAQQRARRATAEAELEAASGLRGLFSRGRLTRQLEAVRAGVETVRQRVAAKLDQRSDAEAEPPPEFEGLDLAAKREINLAIIALAQQLYLHFSAHDLARRARQAAHGNVQDMNYGTEQECRALIARIQEAREGVASQPNWSAPVKTRAEMVAAEAKFRSERETVPMASSVARIDRPAEGGKRAFPLEVNVLAEEYWDLYDTFIP